MPKISKTKIDQYIGNADLLGLELYLESKGWKKEDIEYYILSLCIDSEKNMFTYSYSVKKKDKPYTNFFLILALIILCIIYLLGGISGSLLMICSIFTIFIVATKIILRKHLK